MEDPKKNIGESKEEKTSKDSNISKETNDIQKCYVCLDIPQEPIYPGGCTHVLCKKHLRVIILLNI